jgi:glycosyltransferase involved in cell wall biosynthesis
MQQLPRWKRLRHRAYYDFEWRRRMGSYQRAIAISEFVRRWALRRWRIACDVVYPPVDIDFGEAPKENLIVSVGRFNLRAHKKQLELMAAFAEMKRDGFDSWSYTSIGGLNTTADNHDYFDAIRRSGAGCSGTAEANLTRAAVKERLQRARIFWHGMGLNEDTLTHPGRAEHFGIATVEAMAAGCVPVVIDKGGQSEIVEHGVTGFKWSTVEELKRYTRLLTDDPALWARLSSAARSRAQAFNRDRFVQELSSTCGVHIDDSRLRIRAA